MTPLRIPTLVKLKEKYDSAVYRPGIGYVKLDRRSVKTDRNHLLYPNKIASFVSVADTITKGIVTDVVDNYKGHNENRLIISSPIIINGQRYIQDVVIRQAPLKENRYITRMYLHDVNLVKIENGIQSFTNPALGLQGVRPIESLNQNIADSQDNSSGSTQFSRQLNDVATHTSDSDGQPLTSQQQEFFKDSKVRDEDGNLRVVYHGTDQDFTVFDPTKGRSNMDIQGMFFSPWDIDAEGYGPNVKAYYLNIKNPASKAQGYAALRRFQGQNNAGVKAREYLERLGYDGVNNGDEEYIAFHPEQITLIDTSEPTNNPDIRYSYSLEFDTPPNSDPRQTEFTVMFWVNPPVP